MLQLAQYQDGRLELQEAPAPQPPPGGILVQTRCSVISPGTEKMKVEQARMSLIQKARARPDQVKKVMETARTLGWKAAMTKVRNRLESPSPLGYSASGVVVAVDPLNTRFRVGDRVACGGAECAFHAEMIAVPDLLAAPVPEGVEDWQAAYTTLTAISMQAVRQAEGRIGDRIVVVGQGLVGLLATNLLAASGVRVLGVDYAANRLSVATTMGAERTVNPSQQNLRDEVLEWTGGIGADAVLLCVGGKGADAADSAIACLRDRGVMVIVGIYDAELSWKTAYMKDIQVRYSRSYGPGRYDPEYEWGGKDYPPGYVRWTENRNFEACLHLMRTGALNLQAITSRQAPFQEAVTVYDQLMQPGNADIGVVLNYQATAIPQAPTQASNPLVGEPANKTLAKPVTTLDVIGAGNFVRTMLLPHLQGQIALGTVVNGTGLSARHTKSKFGFAEAATDPKSTFGKKTHALLIGTRHHLHAPMVLQGLRQNQQVFVEKPLCLNREELSEIDQAITTTEGSVMVGFNRRFAPATEALIKQLSHIAGPKTLAYHVYAGPLAPDHWYADISQSGGRVLGEACHFFDYACFLFGQPARVTAQSIGRAAFPDSISAQIEFTDGSSAQIIYSAGGDHAFPKESFRVFASGFVAECENFQSLSFYQRRKRTVKKFSSKGHSEEMAAWLGFLKGESKHPLPYAQARQSMALTFAALDSIREGRSISLI